MQDRTPLSGFVTLLSLYVDDSDHYLIGRVKRIAFIRDSIYFKMSGFEINDPPEIKLLEVKGTNTIVQQCSEGQYQEYFASDSTTTFLLQCLQIQQ